MMDPKEQRRRQLDAGENLVGKNEEVQEINRGVIAEFRANQGEVIGPYAQRLGIDGLPVVLVTMTGAKTGRTLTCPLMHIRDGDRVVIVASYGGGPHNPPWYYNLLANPVATLEMGTEKFKVRASQVHGKERDRLYDLVVQQMPFFGDYQKKAPREIPVLTLERIE